MPKKQEGKKYIVIHDFKDLKDNGKIYITGDVFPKPGSKKPSASRIKELSSKSNNIGKQLIKEQD
ncbi:hypothetical protein LCM23_25450 [Cytobacillus kochii]|uniref:hypothetical protein n=1 Tax=Cytobacillus kochii TaxID=859143 RepID=UPI001CD5B1AD|nr:hypothetical protein [Cytobacillus kochii]MCA1029361.1 hypothetical protein [Cytobacillus kochii]